MAAPVEDRRTIHQALGEIDRRGWELWAVSLSISVVLAAGFAGLLIPSLRSGIVDLGERYLDYLPQVLVGLVTLVLLAGIYLVIKQRELNQLRRLLISSNAETVASSVSGGYPLDATSGVLDRRALPDILELETSRANRYRAPFCVVLYDIRGFGRINAQVGNLAGDQILRETAKALKSTTRKTDVVVRYGSDEYLCLLPATDAQGGQHFTRRVAKALETCPRLVGVALDSGLAAYHPGVRPVRQPADVLAEAERELEAKRTAPAPSVG